MGENGQKSGQMVQRDVHGCVYFGTILIWGLAALEPLQRKALRSWVKMYLRCMVQKYYMVVFSVELIKSLILAKKVLNGSEVGRYHLAALKKNKSLSKFSGILRTFEPFALKSTLFRTKSTTYHGSTVNTTV